MTLDMVLTLAVMVGVVVALGRELISPPATMLGAVIVLVVLDVVEPAVAFAGFSSTATLTIAGLFVVARAVQVHGGLERGLTKLLGSGDNDRRTLIRLVLPVVATSSVIANTPIVATLAPMVRDWADRHGRAPSHLLMPLSFAALLGGIITTIGTSTTLVVSGIISTPASEGGLGLPAFSFFETLPIGLPAALVGTVAMIVLAPIVLPDRRLVTTIDNGDREYLFRLGVTPGGPLDGQTIAEGGLRNLDDVYVAAIRKSGRDPRPARPGTTMIGGDVLTFVGRVSHVESLRRTPGLELPDETQANLLDGDADGLVEVVLGNNSPLLGRTPKSSSFRGRYGAAIVAVHRGGERVDGRLGDVVLRPGDALLLLTDVDFVERWMPRRDFAVIVPVESPERPVSGRRLMVLGITLAMIVAAAAGIVDILTAVLAACLVLGVTRTVRFWDARASLDLDVLIIVAAAIGLGGAVTTSGLAGEAAGGIEAIAGGAGSLAALAAVLVGTLIMTELITNVAAAALMVPIAVDIANRVGEDPRGWAVGVAIMASASFLTPIGYQTNTIVYGLGGYRFGDYWRLGLPLTITVLAAAMLLIPVVY